MTKQKKIFNRSDILIISKAIKVPRKDDKNKKI